MSYIAISVSNLRTVCTDKVNIPELIQINFDNNAYMKMMTINSIMP